MIGDEKHTGAPPATMMKAVPRYERIRDEYKNAPTPPVAAAAWKRLKEAEDKFVELFAAKLFPKEPDSAIQRRLLTELTAQTRSRACLLGLVMTSALFINRYESERRA